MLILFARQTYYACAAWNVLRPSDESARKGVCGRKSPAVLSPELVEGSKGDGLASPPRFSPVCVIWGREMEVIRDLF